jgi:hypothetical protein
LVQEAHENEVTNMTKEQRIIYLFFIVIFVALTGCGGGQKSVVSPTIGNQVDEQIPTIVKPKVKVLDRYNVQIIERTPNSLTLSGEAPPLERDDVLVSGQGEGLLRKVVSVHRNRNGITIQTVPASLEDVFEQAHIHISKTLTPDDIILVEPLPEGVTLTVPNRRDRGEVIVANVSFKNKLILGDKEKNNIAISGNTSIGLGYNVDMRIINGKLVYFLTYVELKLNLSFVAKCNISFIRGEFKDVILLIPGKPFVVYVAGIPLVLRPELGLYGGAYGTLVAGLELGIIMENSGKIGAEFKDGFWHPIAEVIRNMRLPPDFEIKLFANLSAQLYVLFEFKWKLYESAGAYVKFKPFVEGSYTFQPNPTPTHTIDILGGANAGVGAGLEIPLLGYKIASFEKEAVLELKGHLPPFPITLSGSAEVPISIQ